MAPSSYPFGLTNAAAAYASAHAEPLGCHQRFAIDLIATTLACTHVDSSEDDEAWAGVDFSRLRDPKAMRRFMAASDYCFGYSDSDDEDTYDPTRECFNIELEMPSASHEDEGQAVTSRPTRGQATPHLHVSSPRRREMRTPPLRNFDA